MTAIYIGILILAGLVVHIWRDIRRSERKALETPRMHPRCEGCDCTGRCEAAALVRRTLAEMGVEVGAK